MGLPLLAAVGLGLLSGWWLPRGPVSTFEGLAVMGLGLLAGLVAGVLLRTRWAMLVAPMTFAVAFEPARLGVTGPIVDGIHLGSTYGVLALAVGRGVHGLLALLPMVLGAALGAAWARRRLSVGRPERGFLSGLASWLRRVVAVTTAVVLVAVAVFVARPATTEPFVDGSSQPVVGSVAELTRVEIGGHDLALMIRGRSATSPVLLFLAGGPGGSELGAMRRDSQALEDDFVVATLDHRGSGKSYEDVLTHRPGPLRRSPHDCRGRPPLMEQLHILGGFMDTFSVLYPQIQDVDFRTQATTLDVPVYLAQGAHEAPGRAEPAMQWFDLLEAPRKRLVNFDTSGHRPLWEQPSPFRNLMATVLAETRPARR